jgi:hypothetical protein
MPLRVGLHLAIRIFSLGITRERRSKPPGSDLIGVIPRSEKEGMKPPYVCLGCSNHTHGNNMINRYNVIK